MHIDIAYVHVHVHVPCTVLLTLVHFLVDTHDGT